MKTAQQYLYDSLDALGFTLNGERHMHALSLLDAAIAEARAAAIEECALCCDAIVQSCRRGAEKYPMQRSLYEAGADEAEACAEDVRRLLCPFATKTVLPAPVPVAGGEPKQEAGSEHERPPRSVVYEQVLDFFKGNGAKADAWMEAPSPMFGGLSAKQLLVINPKKVLTAVRQALDENAPADSAEAAAASEDATRLAWENLRAFGRFSLFAPPIAATTAVEAKVRVLACDAVPTDKRQHFLCDSCGAHIGSDEDCCCLRCGADLYVEDCACATPPPPICAPPIAATTAVEGKVASLISGPQPAYDESVEDFRARVVAGISLPPPSSSETALAEMTKRADLYRSMARHVRHSRGGRSRL